MRPTLPALTETMSMQTSCDVVHIWISDGNGSYLIQRRSPNKRAMPGVWTVTGGRVNAVEDSLRAANRETFEELGIDLRLSHEDFCFVHNGKQANVAVYATIIEPSARLNINTRELDCVMWDTEDKIDSMRAANLFWAPSYFDSSFDKIKTIIGR